MCGNRRAKLVSVMDGHRPQIRCEGRWRWPYMDARYVAAVGYSKTAMTGSETGLTGEGGGGGYILARGAAGKLGDYRDHFARPVAPLYHPPHYAERTGAEADRRTA